MKWCAALALPGLVFSTIGHLVWCPFIPVPKPAIADVLVRGGAFEGRRLFFRIVTRGKYLELVKENAEAATEVLRKCLPMQNWVVEVVTDNPLNLSTRSNAPVTEIVVPDAYCCPRGAKYKARALNYAIEHSAAAPRDRIVHLDEETHFEEDTYTFACLTEEERDEWIAKIEIPEHALPLPPVVMDIADDGTATVNDMPKP